jgi:hypothetical protein
MRKLELGILLFSSILILFVMDDKVIREDYAVNEEFFA